MLNSTAVITNETAPLLNDTCEDGLLLAGPLRTHRNALIYMAILLWTFLGVAIAADAFMLGIETITSQEQAKTVVVDGRKRVYSLKIWNATVANLTLMALGSSAPEILLSLIEIVSSGFYSGELGPSTIVGSAAFNLFIIAAVCVVAVAAPKKVADTGVFSITAAASVFAYVWLAYILLVSSPNVIEVWEGAATLAFFPLLVWLAYLADVGAFSCPDKARPATHVVVAFTRDGKPIRRGDLARELQRMDPDAADGMSDAQGLASYLASSLGTLRSRAAYRVATTRGATGVAAPQARAAAEQEVAPPPPAAVLSFAVSGAAFSEGAKEASLVVERSGEELDWEGSVEYESRDGTAHAGQDYTAVSGRLCFARGQRSAVLAVPLLDDEVAEEDETFFVDLHRPSAGARLGRRSTMAVTIIDDDGPGEVTFAVAETRVRESQRVAVLEVERKRGVQGAVSVGWRTADGTALASRDYVPSRGRLTFAPGVTRAAIEVEIIDDGAYDLADESFAVVLDEPGGGASLGEIGRAVVVIESDDERRALVKQVATLMSLNVDAMQLAGASWREQLAEAVTFEPPRQAATARALDGPLLGGASPPAALSLGCPFAFAGFALALPWRLLFALTPPPRVAGGWACFFVALVGIGVITALVGDLAAHMGCCLGMKPAVTAITFVALGTSLPDTFASRTAALKERHADSSIGNITGSNSVNVFLGLGLPWLAAALFWASPRGAAQETSWRDRYRGEAWYSEAMPVAFVVASGDLGFSVAVFTVLALVCLAVLVARRATVGGELGGGAASKYSTATLFTALWLGYIWLSIAKTEGDPRLARLLQQLPPQARALLGA